VTLKTLLAQAAWGSNEWLRDCQSRKSATQEPNRPYPYDEEEVRLENQVARVKLAGTLTLPRDAGPHPAVVLITGSGPQDRDESLWSHKPFLVLADHLTRLGIAVLRCDDRGTYRSKGDFAAATHADFVNDALAAIGWMKTHPRINHRRIGLIGHSEGGIIAPLVGARNPAVAFMVLLAGSGVTGDEIILAQSSLIGTVTGLPREQVEANARNLREILNLITKETDEAVLQVKLREALTGKVPPAQVDLQLKTLTTPWFRYFLTYDPAATLRRVTKPVLAMNGEKDLQVPAKQNLDAIRAALSAAGNTHAEIVEMPGLNHLFQTAKTGSPAEYGVIEETIAPAALEKIARWIASQ
jgi:hypothetical protein